ncbi:glucosamine-6-phosphate deaminase [Zafaria cholistanensis]|uniref:Glucosamine-6-phosphate deaminase n=1 Tax=Zafaria cholistanensis TaxID=1682741 RepID=A0A5A7NPC9_9MICC|nr:glucosamine-6-phosphate deaminase [Zafaria cholistanensis]GER21628.1 glucosamine-6-phosphate deaminase [Zafaria cholistanensis]
MEIIVLPDADAAGRHAAGIIARTIAARPRPVVGVATGSSPLATYRELAALVARGLDVSRTTAFALDEYVGLGPEHPQSYHAVVDREVTRRLGLDPGRVHVPDGSARDLEAACAAYEQAITAAGGVDIQLLGVGANGHIGFNEPGSSLGSATRVKTLAPGTRRDNARFFGGDPEAVPVHCLTQGIGTILRARRLVLVATGAAKAQAVATLAEGPLGAYCPATALQLHPEATVVVDEEAAAQLALREYYDFARDHARDLPAPPA